MGAGCGSAARSASLPGATMAVEASRISDPFLAVITCLLEDGENCLVPCVKAAYRQGCSTQDLLAAVDIARYLRDLPAPLLRRAWEAVHDWAWIDARRRAQGGRPASTDARAAAFAHRHGAGPSLASGGFVAPRAPAGRSAQRLPRRAS